MNKNKYTSKTISKHQINQFLNNKNHFLLKILNKTFPFQHLLLFNKKKNLPNHLFSSNSLLFINQKRTEKIFQRT